MERQSSQRVFDQVGQVREWADGIDFETWVWRSLFPSRPWQCSVWSVTSQVVFDLEDWTWRRVRVTGHLKMRWNRSIDVGCLPVFARQRARLCVLPGDEESPVA